MNKSEITGLHGLAEMKTKIIEIAYLLVNEKEKLYSRKEAAAELLKVARDMTEEEMAILRKLDNDNKNENRLRGTLAGEREDDL